ASTILTVSAPAVVRRLRTRQRPARPGHPVTCGTSCVPTIGDTGYWMPAGAYHRAALRADPLAGMTAETSQRILAACPARALHQHSPSKKPEGAGKTGWPLHPGPLAPEKLREGRVTTGTGGYTPAFPAQWFTAYFGLSPVNQLVCHRRRPRCVGIAADLAPAWARQDHTTSPSAIVPFVDRHLRVHRNPPRVS